MQPAIAHITTNTFGECPRCGQMTPQFKPNCCQCGQWQAWGDGAVITDRSRRLREFLHNEEREEREWQDVRDAPDSRAPSLGRYCRWRRSLYLFFLHPQRAAGLGAGLGFAGALIVVAAIAGTQRVTPQQTPSARSAATGLCHDETLTYAGARQGACSNHGGVKEWYP